MSNEYSLLSRYVAFFLEVLGKLFLLLNDVPHICLKCEYYDHFDVGDG